MQLTQRHREYWSKNLTMTSILLTIWFLVTFGMGYFARELSTFKFFGWPFSFYMAAQGSLAIFVVEIAVYAYLMNRKDEEYGIREEA